MQVSGNHESSTAIKEQIASNQGGASANAEKQQFSATEWQALVGRIQAGDELALEQLYNLFGRGVRYYLYRQLGPQELEDRLHDTFLIVVRAIQRADLREPERLMGFVRTVVRRQVAAYIDAAVQKRREQSDLSTSVPLTDHNQNPEREAIDIQNEKLMQSALAALSERDRDILVRFYLLEQSQEQICREMELNATQFRLLKSRAKPSSAKSAAKSWLIRAYSQLLRELQRASMATFDYLPLFDRSSSVIEPWICQDLGGGKPYLVIDTREDFGVADT